VDVTRVSEITWRGESGRGKAPRDGKKRNARRVRTTPSQKLSVPLFFSFYLPPAYTTSPATRTILAVEETRAWETIAV
jgi:hypothetical protein